jgi:hypothetical protein
MVSFFISGVAHSFLIQLPNVQEPVMSVSSDSIQEEYSESQLRTIAELRVGEGATEEEVKKEEEKVKEVFARITPYLRNRVVDYYTILKNRKENNLEMLPDTRFLTALVALTYVEPKKEWLDKLSKYGYIDSLLEPKGVQMYVPLPNLIDMIYDNKNFVVGAEEDTEQDQIIQMATIRAGKDAGFHEIRDEAYWVEQAFRKISNSLKDGIWEYYSALIEIERYGKTENPSILEEEVSVEVYPQCQFNKQDLDEISNYLDIEDITSEEVVQGYGILGNLIDIALIEPVAWIEYAPHCNE